MLPVAELFKHSASEAEQDLLLRFCIKRAASTQAPHRKPLHRPEIIPKAPKVLHARSRHVLRNHLANLFLERFNGHCVCYAGLQVRQTDRFVPVPVPFGLAIP